MGLSYLGTVVRSSLVLTGKKKEEGATEEEERGKQIPWGEELVGYSSTKAGFTKWRTSN